MFVQPVLKIFPEEFCVRENLVIPRCSSEGRFFYYYLFKIGYSTFDAVSIISEILKINKSSLTYAGLKDEDGQTEQLICSDQLLSWNKIRKLNEQFSNGEKTVYLTYHGRGNFPVSIGNLNGNGFYVVVRNVDQRVEDHFNFRREQFHFLNYYDTQRFGLPHKPKVTHKIGSALSRNQYDEAAHYLKLSGSRESNVIQDSPNACAFFKEEVDHRLYSFYLSSHGSYLWNNKLNNFVTNEFIATSSNYDTDGFTYNYLRNQREVLDLMLKKDNIKYLRTSMKENRSIHRSYSHRSTVVSTQVNILSVEEDDLFPGKIKIHLSFFLPSGSYATCLIKQYIFRFYK